MIGLLNWRTGLLAVSVLVCLWSSATAQRLPDQLVLELTEELYELVDSQRDVYKDNPAMLKEAVDQRMRQHVDTVYSARLVLGRYGRSLSNEQIAQFADALGSSLMDQYATRLLDFDRDNVVEVLPLEANQDPRRTRVRTRLTLDNGSLMPVDYVMRQVNERWLVFDVIVEGISYVATFRNQIGEQIAAEGFDQTLARLQQGQLALSADEGS